MDEETTEEEPQTRAPMRTVPADGLTVDEPFTAPADVASQWDFRDWRPA
ncbi:hypothetical protein [Streptomyces smyrnaeus]